MKKHVSKMEAARLLGVSLRTVDNMIHRGELPVIQRLGHPRIPRRALERLGKSTALADRRVEPAEPTEVIAPPQPEVLFDVLIERKLAKMAKESVNTILEPFFQSKTVSDEMRRRQTIAERARWGLYFQKFGCLTCETKTAPHIGCGMCAKCYQRTVGRLRVVVEQAESAVRKRGALIFHDLTEEAQSALRDNGDTRAE